MFKVRIVNPGKKRSKVKRNKKGQFTKGGGRRRRRRRNPGGGQSGYETNPRRRRRRRRSTSSRRRRRRRNPASRGGFGGGILKSYDYKDLIPYMLSCLAQAWTVRRWGDAWGTSMLSGQPLQSSIFRGHAWTLKNYLIAGATAWVGSKVIARSGMLGGASAAKVFWRCFVENAAQRLLWSEVIARWDWGRSNFGQLPSGCRPGDVWDDPQGNRWVCAQNGQWVSMQGLGGGYGELVQAGPLGSSYGELVQAGPLGYGELVQAGPLGYGADPTGGFMPLGHLLPEDTSDVRSEHAQQLNLGARDPYAAVMQAA